jgi:hypothetical protein
MGYPYEKGKKGKPGYTPLMSACYDIEFPQKCRPVEGITVTGGSFPAQMWALYMNEAVGILDVPPSPWPTPEDMPDEKIGSSPPPPTTFAPAPPATTEEEEPTPDETKSEEPPEPPPPPSSEPPPPPPSSEPPPPPPSTEPPPTPNRNGGGNGNGGGGGNAASIGFTGLLLLLTPALAWRRRSRGGRP